MVLADSYFKAQPAQILDPTDEEMYAELKQSNFYAKYQPDNMTLFENPYARLKIAARENVLLENFEITTREHFLRDFAITCLVQNTEKPHHIHQFFLSSNSKGNRLCYVFVHNQREEIVVLAKVQYQTRYSRDFDNY